jgi:hypothetical protein
MNQQAMYQQMTGNGNRPAAIRMVNNDDAGPNIPL